MNTLRRPLLTRLLVTASLIAIPLLAATDWEAAGKRWWAHVQFLASDELEGRLTGTEGYRKAADYVAKQFKAYGLVARRNQGLLPAGSIRSAARHRREVQLDAGP